MSGRDTTENINTALDLAVKAFLSISTGAISIWYRVELCNAFYRVLKGNANPQQEQAAMYGLAEAGNAGIVTVRQFENTLQEHGQEIAATNLHRIREDAVSEIQDNDRRS